MNRDRIEGTLRDVAGKMEQAVGMATGDAGRRGRGLAHEIGGKGQHLFGRAQDGLDAASDATRGIADDIGARTAGASAAIHADLGRGATSLRRQVQRSPLTTLILVGAAGYALGLLSNTVSR